MIPLPVPRSIRIVPFPEVDKMGQEEGIERKTIAPFLLDDPEAAPEDRIDRLL